MNEVTIDRNSWHYNLVTQMYGNPERKKNPMTFCEYWSVVIFSIIFAVAFILLMVVFVFMLISLIIVSFVNPYPTGLMIFALFSIVIGITYYVYKKDKKDLENEEKDNNTSKTKSPNIFWVKYKSWKEKICPVVKFK